MTFQGKATITCTGGCLRSASQAFNGSAFGAKFAGDKDKVLNEITKMTRTDDWEDVEVTIEVTVSLRQRRNRADAEDTVVEFVPTPQQLIKNALNKWSCNHFYIKTTERKQLQVKGGRLADDQIDEVAQAVFDMGKGAKNLERTKTMVGRIAANMGCQIGGVYKKSF